MMPIVGFYGPVITAVLVEILTWGQSLRKAEMILFRDVCGQI